MSVGLTISDLNISDFLERCKVLYYLFCLLFFYYFNRLGY